MSREGRLGISRNTLALGWVSMFTDMASEMIYALLPLFLVNSLGLPKWVVGLIEGIAESTASLVKLYSGWLADRTRRYKLLTFSGYGISALTRPLFALAVGPWSVLALRFLDRVGKGVRTAPRDVLIAESTPPELTGRAYGFHRSMDTVGAVLGPGLATLLLPLCHGDFRLVFLVAAVPGFVALVLILAFVRETPVLRAPTLPSWRWAAVSPAFRWFLASSFVFGLANSSNVFLILRTQDLGVPTALVPVVYLVFNLVYVLVSWPAGILSDRLGRPRVLALGFLAFIAIYAGFALATAAWMAWLLFAGYGIYSGLSEGVARAWVRDLAPEAWRGSAFGLYHFAVGLAALPASLLGGVLWDRLGASATFAAGAALAGVAAMLFAISWWRHQHAAIAG